MCIMTNRAEMKVCQYLRWNHFKNKLKFKFDRIFDSVQIFSSRDDNNTGIIAAPIGENHVKAILWLYPLTLESFSYTKCNALLECLDDWPVWERNFPV